MGRMSLAGPIYFNKYLSLAIPHPALSPSLHLRLRVLVLSFHLGMDLSKKRKTDENGAFDGGMIQSTSKLLPADIRRIIEPFSKEQLLDIVQEATARHPDVLDAVRTFVDGDVSQRKLFIRGLGWETTTENIRNLFSAYGELQEAIVIFDKATGKSKGYGFIIFKHIDGAILALKEPSKMIDGRMTVTQLASGGGGIAGPTGMAQQSVDVSMRKIFVGNVPFDMPADRLLLHFLSYGEIEEGPLGFDKQTGKSKGYALFVYKTAEGARASLVDPIKTLDGAQMICKLAIEGKKGKPGVGGSVGAGVPGQTPMGGGVGDVAGDGFGLGGPQSGSYPGGISSYGGYSGAGMQAATGHGQYHPLNSSVPSTHGMGARGLSSVSGQVGVSGYGSSFYGGSSQFGGPGASSYGGLGGLGPSFQTPSASASLPSGGFPDGGPYGLSGSTYQSQHHQQPGSSPGARVPARGGMYQGMPPYY